MIVKGIEGNPLDGLIPPTYHYRLVVRDNTHNGDWYPVSIVMTLEKCIDMARRDFPHYPWADITILDINNMQDIPIGLAEDICKEFPIK